MISNFFIEVRQSIKIFFFHHNDHYGYIKSLPAFFKEKKFCFICFKPYQIDFFTNVSRYVNFVREKEKKEM
jgi:hypothetical protein